MGASAKLGDLGVGGGSFTARSLHDISMLEGVRIRTARKFTDAGAVKDASTNNDPNYHNKLMGDIVRLLGDHAEQDHGVGQPDLLDKIAAMDFKGETISVGYQRQQSVDLRGDMSLTGSIGYEVGGSAGITYEKTYFSGQSRVDQTGAMKRTVAIFSESSNVRQTNAINVQLPSIPTSKDGKPPRIRALA